VTVCQTLTVPDAALEAVLAGVPDPEIPVVTVVDLGILRGVRVRPDGGREVVLTPTYTGCPATLAIEASVRSGLDAAGFRDVTVVTELSPPWSTDWITDAGREKLRAYGIAPPEKDAARNSLKPEAPAQCPQCGSCRTHEVSRFGSTPCKALWRCEACAEPFDRFKCL
jgi:ring-1,2-phenylacetyl-CoA epoxidase subunit PaaD